MKAFVAQSKKKQRGKGQRLQGISKRKQSRKTKPSIKIKIKGPLDIKDLNFDCLERVFLHLNATDLSNVADAHPYFVPAARFVYKRIYGEHFLAINESNCYLSHNKIKEIIKVQAKSFLRNFGLFIRGMSLDYLNDVNREKVQCVREIEEFIAEYCTNTLNGIRLANCHGNIMEKIQNPFEKVNRVQIERKFAETTNIDLKKCFPNTQYMLLNNEVNIVEKNVRNIIQCNPQLRELIIMSDDKIKYSAEFLGCLSENLTQLQNLNLVNLEFEGAESMKHIHFPNVSLFLLQSNQSPYPDNISISFGQLKYLELYGVSDDLKWIDFILKNKSLFSLSYGSNANIDYLTQIITQLPHLSKLIFETADATFTIEEFTHFLEICAPIINLKFIGKMYSDENVMEGGHNLRNINADLKRIFNLTYDKFNNVRDGLGRLNWHLLGFQRK